MLSKSSVASSSASTHVLPRLTLWAGPRTEAAGLADRSKASRTIAEPRLRSLAVGAARDRLKASIKTATCSGWITSSHQGRIDSPGPGRACVGNQNLHSALQTTDLSASRGQSSLAAGPLCIFPSARDADIGERMKLVRTVWRDLGGLLVVCLLATLVIALGGASSISKNETAAVASSSAIADCDAVDVDNGCPDDHPADSTNAGLDRECHDGPAMTRVAEAIATPSITAQRHVGALVLASNSHSPGGLERPPRA